MFQQLGIVLEYSSVGQLDVVMTPCEFWQISLCGPLQAPINWHFIIFECFRCSQPQLLQIKGKMASDHRIISPNSSQKKRMRHWSPKLSSCHEHYQHPVKEMIYHRSRKSPLPVRPEIYITIWHQKAYKLSWRWQILIFWRLCEWSFSRADY